MSERVRLDRVNEQIARRGLWWAFHKHLMLELFEELREHLGDEYLVDLESEILLVPRSTLRQAQDTAGVARRAAPDVTVSLVPAPAAGGQTPVLTPALVEVDEEITEFEQYSIQIRRRGLADPDDPFRVQVVSVLELLSPSNKGASGARDWRKFLAKRQDYLSSSVSYTEIDLLRSGERELPSALEVLADYPFVAWSSQLQVETRHHWAWGWDENDPLPTIGVPLEYPRIHPLELALCYRRAYERNRWDERLKLVAR